MLCESIVPGHLSPDWRRPSGTAAILANTVHLVIEAFLALRLELLPSWLGISDFQGSNFRRAILRGRLEAGGPRKGMSSRFPVA